MSQSTVNTYGRNKPSTGILGRDEFTPGGMPEGRPILVCGTTNCGTTLFAADPPANDPQHALSQDSAQTLRRVVGHLKREAHLLLDRYIASGQQAQMAVSRQAEARLRSEGWTRQDEREG